MCRCRHRRGRHGRNCSWLHGLGNPGGRRGRGNRRRRRRRCGCRSGCRRRLGLGHRDGGRGRGGRSRLRRCRWGVGRRRRTDRRCSRYGCSSWSSDRGCLDRCLGSRRGGAGLGRCLLGGTLLCRLGIFGLFGPGQSVPFRATTQPVGLRLDDAGGLALRLHAHLRCQIEQFAVRHPELFRKLVYAHVLRQTL